MDFQSILARGAPAPELDGPAFEDWFARVEDYVTAMGVRCLLVHVSADDWQRSFDEGLTAEEAVLNRLAGVAD